MCPGRATCIRIHTVYVLTDTCWRIHVARSGYMLTVSRRHYLLFIYVTVDLYPFVSSNRRATNWQQFCCRNMLLQHVASSNMKQHVAVPIVNAAVLFSIVSNYYRPISNLSFLSKLLERAVLRQRFILSTPQLRWLGAITDLTDLIWWVSVNNKNETCSATLYVDTDAKHWSSAVLSNGPGATAPKPQGATNSRCVIFFISQFDMSDPDWDLLAHGWSNGRRLFNDLPFTYQFLKCTYIIHS